MQYDAQLAYHGGLGHGVDNWILASFHCARALGAGTSAPAIPLRQRELVHCIGSEMRRIVVFTLGDKVQA